MLPFLRRIIWWREERKLIENPAKQDDQKVRALLVTPHHEERELIERVGKQNNQQAQELLAAFHKLQCTMDPLIAAQVYNSRFCPLTGRLPDELILCILTFLRDDVVALSCLRIASRKFLYILGNELFEEYMDHRLYHPIVLPKVPKDQFRRLLQRDDRCDNCKRWNNTCNPQYSDCCKFRPRSAWGEDAAEYTQLHRKLHCYACNTLHFAYEFAFDKQESSNHQPKRQCLGQQGSVQLCKHIQITWATIKAHIDDWRRQQQYRGGDWQACLDSFNIECHDASHDTRCAASEPPTWPRARLNTMHIGLTHPDTVVLNLEWTPHSRIDTMALTAEGRIPAPELRLLFYRLRGLGPANALYPLFRFGDPPEMAFFGPLSHLRHFVHYQTGEDDQTSPPTALIPPIYTHVGLQPHISLVTGRHGKMLSMKLHPLRSTDAVSISSYCVVLRYETDIIICRARDLTDPTVKIVPTDCWLHAMDTQTYPHPQASHIRPQCRDITCVNYFKRHKGRHYCQGWDCF
ncbi:hypothetical protein COCMIDRAFT_108752 [Bipolaris oryzae ATCC 44560]|uniref:F-box domain-containing protein n=1 Tax=Bipolaris oryzae ATCC 44560 TaxID=930090 RepID=W6YMG2_COCMI|nr:uncharacterized protein COCMIDRAFT_108752 [Bipolaris oryzae ATCC 44560]EUC40472.1 hypothetical protein COCMIDRAFT_108752 [Bipolaris oryzae ATCC 44560]